jgi:hypothetical protein
MTDRYALRKDILELIDNNPLNNVDITLLIEKYTAGKEIDEQAQARVTILNVLREMREDGDISFADQQVSITIRSAGVFTSNSGIIRSTNKYEKEKEREKQAQSLYIGGNVTGNINTGKVGGSLHQTSTNTNSITEKEEQELQTYGLTQAEIDELKEIVKASPDKPTLTSKAMKWLGTIGVSIAGRGLYENIPAITDFIHKLIS